jgi:AcrR family transcriptional regulator
MTDSQAPTRPHPPARTRGLPHELPRGRHNLPRQVVLRSQRERMIDSIIEVVAAKGYLDATVADVIQGAAVSRKTFYEHFESKQDCFIAAYDEIVGHLLEEVTRAHMAADTWMQGIASVLEVLLELLASRPALARFCIIDVLAAGPTALARRDAVMDRFHEFVLPTGDSAPDDVPESDVAAKAVVGALYSIIHSEVVRGGARDLPRLLPDLMTIALAPYIGWVPASGEARRAVATASRAS